MNTPAMLYADKSGNIYDHSFLKMSVKSGGYEFLPYSGELIDLPENSRLYFIPDSRPSGYNEAKARFEAADGYAVSVFLPPGYLRLHTPSYIRTASTFLPLYAYTPAGWLNGKFMVPALKIDDDSRWNPALYDYSDNFRPRAEKYLERYPDNRLYKQLAKCALVYHCTAAKNVFYPRWECPIPTSPTCNSNCIGCISKQPAECCPAPQSRINFTPTPEEIAEVAINHAESTEHPIISFGQGCEGDPILCADVIAKAVKLIRKRFSELTINFNSNCSKPDNLAKLIDAGIDSIRVSLISVNESVYNAYYRPQNYTLSDVVKSIEIAEKSGIYISLNLLTYPGLTDRKSEAEKTGDFLGKHRISLIQMRNLNIDPKLLENRLKLPQDEILGLKNAMKLWKKKRKGLKFGYFNRLKSEF
ncbi:MAG: radical SAM protein [Deferribacteraceae bacterium]|jgi:pyruvate-formate lyase-activating enzyme|nr:radical SAM protein [Deferribacteraceae bacterium]